MSIYLYFDLAISICLYAVAATVRSRSDASHYCPRVSMSIYLYFDLTISIYLYAVATTVGSRSEVMPRIIASLARSLSAANET